MTSAPCRAGVAVDAVQNGGTWRDAFRAAEETEVASARATIPSPP